MSAETNNINDLLGEQLSNLDDSLGATVDDVQMLAKIQQVIGRLLSDDGGVEGEIRKVLEERFESGELRKETYQLVKSMLDRYITEQVDTLPGLGEEPPTEPVPVRELDSIAELPVDEFASTAVLPNDVLRPPTADDRVQVGSVLRDRFLLQERVSGGSMGVVYKALDRRLAEAGAEVPWVAIKVLSPELSASGPALRALQQEASKGRCLTHTNIVRFIDLDRDDDLYFIVMEWLEGRNLANILDSADGKNIEVDEAVGIVRQIGAALDYAHRCGIVHADVKPGNIMIMPNGDAKLFDFGVARVRQTQTGEAESFDPGVLGAMTPAYSSMQVLTGDKPVPSDDVFSLACLFYRLVAGYRVFGPRNAAEAADEGMKAQRPQKLTDGQWGAVKKAISYSRVTRFESMSDFVDALAKRTTDTISAEPERRFVDEPEHGSKSWLIGFLALLLLLAFAGYQFGLADKVRGWLDEYADSAGNEPSATLPVVNDVAPLPADMAEGPGSEAPDAGDASDDDAPVDFEERSAVEAVVDPLLDPVAEQLPLIDFSTLPPADVEVPLTEASATDPAIVITLREDGVPVIVDLFRTDAIDRPLRLRVEEVGYSGNRSPWASGQYSISDDGVVEIPAGQDRVRVTLAMASDPLREADQQSTLRIRDADTTTSQLALLEVELEDDDQRRFESGLAPNTIAFAVGQVAVGERDPAVQVDILRFNPDATTVVIGYEIRDITATEGEDYFSPGGNSVSLGPRQRTARLLIPLVQDSVAEGDEAFTVELAQQDSSVGNDVFQRIIVIIRDDEIAAQ